MKRLAIYSLCLLFLNSILISCNPAEKIVTDEGRKNVVPSANQFTPYAEDPSSLKSGQTVYVPIYSSIYNRYEGNLLHMTAILSIRNISMKNELVISKVDYYDTNGKLLKSFIDRPFSLGPLSTKDFVIPETDLTGGTGANFVVKWDAKHLIALPIIESVMIGELGNKGFSFTSRGKEIEQD